MKNHYRTLGINGNATDVEIKKAYKQLALMYHPDVNKSKDASAKFIDINEAYETLIDKVKRARYDIALNEFLSANKPPPIVPKPYPKKPKPFVRYDDIPYAPGVKGTDAEPIVDNSNTKNVSFFTWRFLVWMLLCALASYANHR